MIFVRARRAATACSIAVAAAWVTFVAADVPLLRHDWFPIVPSLHFAVANVTGWDPTGLGAAIGYPASFLVIFARSAVAAAFGSYPAHLAYFAGCGLLIVFGAARLAAVLGARTVASIAAGLFAAFNPWTYTELVAGHSLMLLSYGATYWLVAECCARRRSENRLVALALVVAPQIQFLIVDAALYVWLAFRLRSWRSLLAIAAMLLPVAVGVLGSRGVLLGIPLELEWERSQSLDPFRAVILRGYFAGYDAGLGPPMEAASWLVAALAFAGVATIIARRRRELWLVTFAALPLVWTFGLKGPFGSQFAWAIEHVAELALFRELYDLLGFVAIGYVAFCSVATVRLPLLRVAWLAAGGAMFVSWVLAPPAHFWVGSRTLPVVHVTTARDARFALLPALFPATFHGRGSGTDPELYARDDDVNPVNEAFPLYPVSSAFGSYLRDGATSQLAALGVADVYARPWLRTDPSIRYQYALPLPAWLSAERRGSRTIAAPAPQLSLAPLPRVETLGTNLAGNVLFTDARDAPGDAVPKTWRTLPAAIPIGAPGLFARASEGWVDARLAFFEEPELGQPYGGALTTNSAAILPLHGTGTLLIWVRGALRSQAGTLLSGTTNGYRWIEPRDDLEGVRCSGMCVVAARASRVPKAPADWPAVAARGLDHTSLTPWFVTVTLPAGAAALLRYNVTFDPKWIAVGGRHVLPHVRLDGVTNGWFLTARPVAERVALLETGALAVALAELVACATIGGLLLECALRSRNRQRALRTRGDARVRRVPLVP